MPPGRGAQPTRTTPLPPHPGNAYTPFIELIKLEKLDDRTYRSIALPFAPGGTVGMGRTYGAHVYMQSAWAAAQTLPSQSFHLHHISGNFLLAGELDMPFIYKVKITRTGKSYCTRTVSVTQSESKGICFTCICSFKKPEERQIESQPKINIYKTYANALQNHSPSSFPECPSLDVPFYWALRNSTGQNDAFPGLECRRVDMTPHNQSLHPLQKRQLIFYRSIGEIPLDEPNMHLCAHLYASDRNSLFIVANAFELGGWFTGMSSLAHTVMFHGPVEDLLFRHGIGKEGMMDDKEGGRWFCLEAGAGQLGSGRGVYQARSSNEMGRLVASVVQDGLIRWTEGRSASVEEERVMEEARGRWGKGKGKL